MIRSCSIHIGDYSIVIFPEYKKNEFTHNSAFNEWLFCVRGLIWISKVKPQWRVR
jgi:hypothetical protein